MEPEQISSAAADWRRRVEAAAAKAKPPGPREVEPESDLETQAHERRWEQRIPLRYRKARLDQLTGDLADAAEWDAQSNVLLLGNVGAGKTHAAVALARAVHDAGQEVLFRSALALIDDLKPGDRAAEAMDRALKADLLILDDLGHERQTDFAVDRIARVIVERYDDCRPTIVTSNLSPEDLEREVGPRIFSRLYHGALRLKVAGPDRRREAA